MVMLLMVKCGLVVDLLISMFGELLILLKLLFSELLFSGSMIWWMVDGMVLWLLVMLVIMLFMVLVWVMLLRVCGGWVGLVIV